jgi:hypothetical protein
MANNKYNNKVTDEQIIDAYRRAFGIVARAAKLLEKELKITFCRQSMKERVDALIKQGVFLDDTNESLIDLAESAALDILAKGSEKGKINMINLILKTKGSERGWGEKQSKEVQKIEIEIVTDDKED